MYLCFALCKLNGDFSSLGITWNQRGNVPLPITQRHLKCVYNQWARVIIRSSSPVVQMPFWNKTRSQKKTKNNTVCPLGGATPTFRIQEVSQTSVACEAVCTSSAYLIFVENVMPHVCTLSGSLEVMARPSSDGSTSKDRPSSKQSAISEQ